jgi:glycosyltransferase involved in cell wall biosynthesis
MPRNPAQPVVLDVRVVVGAGGGPEKTILNSPRFLEPAYRNLCAYMHAPGDTGVETLREKARQARAPFLSIPDRGPWDWKVASALLNVCRRERVAIWHGHDYKSNLLGLLLARFWKMRLVTTVHGWVHQTRRTPLYYAVDRWCLPRYEMVVSVSDDLQQTVLDCGVAPEKAVLIENGIDTEQYRRALTIAEAKAYLGIPAGRLVVGAVGRLSAEKGFDLLVHATDRVLKAGVDMELWIVGEGVERTALHNLVESLGIGSRVHLLGYRSDTIPLYQAMDVFALSSLREGLPNVLLEAMALETPVIGTRIAGIPRLIDDKKNGILVEAGSVEALREALSTMLASRELRTRLGQAGRKTVETHFSFRARMQRMQRCYDGLLGRSLRETHWLSRRAPAGQS